MSEFIEIGIALKAFRVAADESIEELALAIEHDIGLIESVESGLVCPSPEFIELVARHYALREQEADRLLSLAGYGKRDLNLDLDSDFKIEDLDKNNGVEVLMNPVFYTDTVNIVSNQYGVVVNFLQSGGKDGKPVVVSRVGMSHEHAKSVIKVLQESLRRAEKKGNTESSK